MLRFQHNLIGVKYYTVKKYKTWFAAMRVALEPVANPTAFRTQRLRIAMLSSLGGKGVSIVSQLLALPLAIAALGIERFRYGSASDSRILRNMS